MSHKWPWRGVSWGLTAIALAPVAAGLAATEAVHKRLISLGYETGLDGDVLAEASELALTMRGDHG